MERLLSKDWKERVDRLNANELLGEVKGERVRGSCPPPYLHSKSSKGLTLHQTFFGKEVNEISTLRQEDENQNQVISN